MRLYLLRIDLIGINPVLLLVVNFLDLLKPPILLTRRMLGVVVRDHLSGLLYAVHLLIRESSDLELVRVLLILARVLLLLFLLLRLLGEEVILLGINLLNLVLWIVVSVVVLDSERVKIHLLYLLPENLHRLGVKHLLSRFVSVKRIRFPNLLFLPESALSVLVKVVNLILREHF